MVLYKIFPKVVDNKYNGSKTASIIFLIIAIFGFFRSCIHFLAPDGGAHSIAGMDLTHGGAKEIIFAFSLWGSSQLLYAIIQLVVYFRYKVLIPFMYLLMILEILMRIFVGHVKPVCFSHLPPGQIVNYVILPLAIMMLLLSIRNQE